MNSLLNRTLYCLCATALLGCAPSLLFAQNFIPDLPQNTQVTQTITIQKLPDNASSAGDDKTSSADEGNASEKTDEQLQEKINQYLKEYEESKKEKEDSKQKPAAKKPKKTVTQPGKFVPFFPAGGTQTVQPEPEGGAPLASQRPAYPRPNRRPGNRPGTHRPRPGKPHTPVFRPMNPAPSVRPIMAPGGSSAVNPGSDPRLYRPPTGIKWPSRQPSGMKPSRPAIPLRPAQPASMPSKS